MANVETTPRNYYQYLQKTVLKCSHNYIVLQKKDYLNWKFARESNPNIKKPSGPNIKISPSRCKSYSCPICGKKKVYDLRDRLKGVNFKGYRFFTLTLKNNYTYDDTEQNLIRITKCFNDLNKALRKRKQFTGLEYFRVIEIGRDGMVHMHGIWNKYIPADLLRSLWKNITKDSYRVKVERIKSPTDVVNYLFKYLTKQVIDYNNSMDSTLFNNDKTNTAALMYELGKRRYQSSRNFFKNSVKKSTDWTLMYYEKMQSKSIDQIIKNEINQFGANREDFDLTLYEFETFTRYMFDTS